MMSRLRRLIVWIVPCAAAVAAAQPAADPARDLARLQAENAALERQIELAGGKEFYLVLDPAVPDLTLRLRGAELHRYPVLAVSVGEPRVGFVRRGERGAWQGVTFSGGRLDPPRELDRLELTPPPPDPSTSLGAGASSEQKAVIPPTPEEAYPVPLRYHIRFDRGPSIEVRPREADLTSRWARLTTWWGARWRDTLAALRPPDGELVRLRVTLAPEDANTLYRSLPPDVKLLVKGK
jgi:hypothetical protein